MDNYEINILRRGGNWKTVKPDDLIVDDINNELKNKNELSNQKSQNDFLSYVTKVETIISSIETLEREKNKLKEDLKLFEVEFLRKKKLAEDKINKIFKEKEMIEKTINLIKNLKTF